ncbi:MAG: hypothetical protein ABIT76_06545 [Chthoniobacterales bacterium]
MSRRASSKIHPGWIAASVLLVVLAIAGGLTLFRNVQDPYRTTAILDTQLYLENANSLRGNTYRVTGTIRNFIRGNRSGRLFSIDVDDANKSVLPVLVPQSLNSMNIQRGQTFAIRLTVDENGILHVDELRKV